MKTRCKFTCESVTHTAQEGAEQIMMRAVGHGRANGGEDDSFSEYTPYGLLNFTVTNPAIVGQFKPGKAYYLDITEADA